MNFSPCLLIPIYNHGGSIAATVDRLAGYGLPILVVDDGSDAPTQAVLAELAAGSPLVRLFRLPENRGKGAAVMRGLREALAAGFTHALQIDADGQHDCADVPRFLACGADHPRAVVCGQPIYDDSVPKGRLYGRYLTHFWVGVETLSFKSCDSMCGYRLYPLAASCALIDRVTIPTRMDFDIEILVRLAWDDLPFQTIATRVCYPAGGVSHFDLVRDNLRISRMHTRLFFGMLRRLPVLLPRLLARKIAARPCPAERGGHWARLAERGSALGLRTLFACYRVFGPKPARLLLVPIVAYFFLTGHAARAASLDYLRRVERARGAGGPRPGWRASFRHMLAFGDAGLDKLAGWAGSDAPRRVHFPERAAFERLLASGRGALLIGAHLGNLEMARALAAGDPRLVVSAVVHTQHAERFNALLRQINPAHAVNLVQVASFGPDTAIVLKERVERGELVVIVGDRTPPADGGSRRVSLVDFLGAPAPFAQGPLILASLLDCPVYLFFCLRGGGRADAYTLHFEPFAERVDLPRGTRGQALQTYLQRYARRLEHYCLLAPEQWFNFYDFWRHAPLTPSDKAST